MIDNPDYYIEPATWDVDRAAIEAVRTEVFIVEQKVPEDEEFDQDDPPADHFLAWSLDGKAIGTARLTPDGRIGRMAVLKDWRGRQVGAALLRSCIEMAQLKHYPKLRLAAQSYAIAFYEQQGFAVCSEEFDDVGIPHRWMERSLEAADVGHIERRRREPPELANSDLVGIATRVELREAFHKLVSACRNELLIFSRELEPGILNDPDLVEELRQLMTAAPMPEVRVVVQDSTRAVKDGHLMLPLAQRLTSVIQIRKPGKLHEDTVSAFAVADRRHSIHRPFGDRWEGSFHPNDRNKGRELARFFDEIWEQGGPDPDLKRLDL